MSYNQGYLDKSEKCLQETYKPRDECYNKCREKFRDAWKYEDEGKCFDKCNKTYTCAKVNYRHDCHRWCEEEYGNLINRSYCKVDCNQLPGASPATLDDTNNTPEDIFQYDILGF